jgi:hypothetical protein
VALSCEIFSCRTDNVTARRAFDRARPALAASFGNSEPGLDVISPGAVVRSQQNNFGCGIFPDGNPNRIGQEVFRLGPTQPPQPAEPFVLEALFPAPTRSTSLRKDVLREFTDVESTSCQRALAIYEREQEILAGANRDHAGSIWRVVGAGKEFGDCSLYLHAVLVSRQL